jgi:hypothetical protein
MKPELSTQDIASVLGALEKPDFKWRTVPGIARETGLAPEVVHQALAVTSDKVVRSSVPSKDGDWLFTTRDHFRGTASVFERVLGSIKNRAE